MSTYYFNVHRGQADVITEYEIQASDDDAAWRQLMDDIPDLTDVFMIFISDKV